MLQLGDGHVMRHMLRPEELELIVIGHPELDFKALEAHTQYEDGFVQESEVSQHCIAEQPLLSPQVLLCALVCSQHS